jgi:hypothetical protein
MEDVVSEVNMQNRANGTVTPTDSAASNTEDPDLAPLYIRHRQNDVLGRIRVIGSGYRLCGGGGGGQEFMGRLIAEGPIVLTRMCVQAVLKACNVR